ncbi:hypothetical protein EMMF5_001248 [Cystobasidiomycetes sp. EMM_F5]
MDSDDEGDSNLPPKTFYVSFEERHVKLPAATTLLLFKDSIQDYYAGHGLAAASLRLSVLRCAKVNGGQELRPIKVEIAYQTVYEQLPDGETIFAQKVNRSVHGHHA